MAIICVLILEEELQKRVSLQPRRSASPWNFTAHFKFVKELLICGQSKNHVGLNRKSVLITACVKINAVS